MPRLLRADDGVCSTGALSSRVRPLFIAVLFVVSLHGLLSMPSGVDRMGSGCMRVMRSLFVLSPLVMLGRFAVMASRMSMMF
jgi:hypothetical protein